MSGTVTDCGYVTCSYYLTRSQVRWLYKNINASLGAGIGISAAICGAMAVIGGPLAIACVAYVAIWGGRLMDAVNQAKERNACVRIRTVANDNFETLVITGIYVDNSGFCHDS
ncbi:hypothetical protein AB0M22_17580 [Nocardia sp. NPDC051756]|uniref:hypothetical protein n=1 Tax=Nocardia sp. NPDC051756 TaxID=3154751 RepID=UPI00342E2521